jgi:hypothetical protein
MSLLRAALRPRLARVAALVRSWHAACRLCMHGPVSCALLHIATQATRSHPAQAASFIDIGTRPILSEDHDQFRTVARKFFASHVTPFHDKCVCDFLEIDGYVECAINLFAGGRTRSRFRAVCGSRQVNTVFWASPLKRYID